MTREQRLGQGVTLTTGVFSGSKHCSEGEMRVPEKLLLNATTGSYLALVAWCAPGCFQMSEQ